MSIITTLGKGTDLLNDTSVRADKFPFSLAAWSTRRVIVACALWLVGAPVLAAIGLILAGLIAAAFSGDTKIGFTARLDNWSLAWFFVPPLLLVSAWLDSKRTPH